MLVINAPDLGKYHKNTLPQILRNYFALLGTALDARRYPILAVHWPGFLNVDGQLAINDGKSSRKVRGRKG